MLSLRLFLQGPRGSEYRGSCVGAFGVGGVRVGGVRLWGQGLGFQQRPATAPNAHPASSHSPGTLTMPLSRPLPS